MKYALTNLSSFTTQAYHLAKISRLIHRHIRTIQKYLRLNGFYQEDNYLITRFIDEKKRNDYIQTLHSKDESACFPAIKQAKIPQPHPRHYAFYER